MKLRGYVSVAVVCLGLLVADPIQRLVVGPLSWLLPSRRSRILNRWIHMLAWLVTRPIEVIGGAHLPPPPPVPCGPGILVIMNHQSLFDIPILVKSLRPGYPRILTRKRYARWIPLISHLLRLYRFPVVDPEGKVSSSRASFRAIKYAAENSEVPLALFPEGTRTRDGEIGRFRKKGLSLVLGARPWTVYVLAADGFWSVAKFKDFVRGVAQVRGQVEVAGVFEWTDTTADPEPFIEELRQSMVRKLDEMRAEASVV